MYPIFVPLGKSKLRYKMGYIDKTGKVLIDPVFDDGTYFYDGLAAIQVKSKWGFIDLTGTVRIQPQFSNPGYFEGGVAAVSTSRGYGVTDSGGDFHLAPDFQEIGRFSEGMAWFVPRNSANDRRYGFLNKGREITIPAIFPHAASFSEGLATVELDGLWGFISHSGLFEIEPSYRGVYDAKGKLLLVGASSFGEGLARVWTGDISAYIDRTRSVLFKAPFEMALPFRDSRALVRRGKRQTGSYGFIDRSGNLAVETRFSFANEFSNGMSSVEVTNQQGRLWGIIDRDGNWIIEPKFLSALEVRDELCFVETEKTIGYVNARGEFIWEGAFVQYRAFGL